MKYFKLGPLLLTAALCCGTLLPGTAKAEPAVSFDFFYDSLDPYGDWIELADYGYCWRPSNVDPDWAPYTDGYWANTDAGWTWVSYEDWGGITYHYGRWARVSGEGWVWVPDYEWAPAWVSWRSSDDYVGWAPLPPRAHWRPEIGFSVWVDDYCDIGPSYYNFCEVRQFGSPALRPVIIDRSRNVTIINRTTNITNITVNKTTNIIYNGGPNYAVLSRKSLKPIQTLKLHQQTDLGDWRNNRGAIMAKQRGNELFVVAPKMTSTQGKAKPQRIARTVQATTIDTGWGGISDPKMRQELHAKIKRDAGNAAPEQAPATAPSERDVKAFEQHLKQSAPTAELKHGGPVQGQGQGVGIENQGGPVQQFVTPAPGVGKKGKHGEALRPFVQPTPNQASQVSDVPAEVQKQPKNLQDQAPAKEVRPNKHQEQELQRQNILQQRQEQNAIQEQNRTQEKQRKQEANQEQMIRAREERQRVIEAQSQQRQQMQAQQAQQESARRERDAQGQQQRQQNQIQRVQEESLRREATQERRQEQSRRVQEVQERRIEQPQKQERAPQVLQPGGAPSEGKKHGKDKDKDKDSDR